MSDAGAKYTVHDDKGPLRVLTVAKVVRNKVIMADASEWEDRDGGAPWQLRDQSYYRGETIRMHQPEHDARIARRKLANLARRMVENVDLVQMPDEVIRALIEFVRPWQTEKKP